MEALAMERIMITIPSELLGDVDSAAERLKQNRSQLIRRAITNFLQQLKQREFEALMAEGYQEISKEDSKIVTESLPLQSAAAEGIWEWNDE
jgi:metal-responsive CopG/Arc/MetJ family transcriptional regulator